MSLSETELKFGLDNKKRRELFRRLIGEPYEERLREYDSWEIPGKYFEWEVPTCIDIEARYASYICPDPYPYGKPNPKGVRYEEYTVGDDGTVSAHRENNGFNANIETSGELEFNFFYHYPYYFNDKVPIFGLSFLPPGEKVSNAGFNLCSIRYDGDLLRDAIFECVFINQSDSKDWLDHIKKSISAPEFGVKRTKSLNVWGLTSGAYTPMLWKNVAEEDNSFIYVEDSGKTTSKGSFHLEESSRFFVLKQSLICDTNILDGISRIMRVPVNVDSELIREVAFSETFVEKSPHDGKSRLVARWRDIGKVIGATLKYEYPLPEGIKFPSWSDFKLPTPGVR